MTIATSPAAYDHEGYVAHVLEDGSLTSTCSAETAARMIGRVVAACDCGWMGSTRYPAVDPLDEAAKGLALVEWEQAHAVPILRRIQGEKWNQLREVVRSLADSQRTVTRELVVEGLAPEARRDVIEKTVAALTQAGELAGQLRDAWEWEATR